MKLKMKWREQNLVLFQDFVGKMMLISTAISQVKAQQQQLHLKINYKMSTENRINRSQKEK